MARTTPCVRESQLVISALGEDERTISVGSVDWYHWLSNATHRSFANGSILGKFTARKSASNKVAGIGSPIARCKAHGVKKHFHTIFHNLQAESRTQAIAAARTFSLV